MPGAAITGELSYNGYSFDGSTKLTVEYLPIPDEAGRTITHVEARIGAEWYVQADAGTDAQMKVLAAQLSKQGQALAFRNKGLGDDLVVNVAGFIADIKCGPSPGPLKWEPVGDDKACRVTWSCVTYLPPVCLASLGGTEGLALRTQVGVMALNYSVSFSVNERGYTTRVTSGYLECAQTRQGRAVLDSVDNYLNFVNPPQLPDFHRKFDRDIDYSKARMDFTITDSQIESPNAYPPGVTKISATHRTRTKTVVGKPMRYDGELSMQVETAANYSKTFALRAFISYVLNRLAGIAAIPGNPLFVDYLEIEEESYNNSSSYGMGYRILKKLPDFAAFKHWTPLGDDWRVWKTSLANYGGAQSQLGLANLALPAGVDAIIDLCGQTGVPWYDPSPRQLQYQTRNLENLRNQTPQPQQSWLDALMKAMLLRDLPVVRQAPLQTPDTTQSVDNMQDTGGLQFPQAAGTSDVIQEGGRPRYSVQLTGYARRVGYPVPRPALQSVGGQTPVEISTAFQQWSEGDHLGVEIHGAAWCVTYMLPNSPGPVPQRLNLENGDNA